MTRPELLRGRDKKPFPFFTVIISVLFALIIALLVFEMWFLGRFTPVCVDGISMKPTLEDGDWLYADAKATPARGDIVIVDVSEYRDEYGHLLFHEGAEPILFIVKRVIAVEGDRLYCKDNQVYLKKKGESVYVPLDEPYAYYAPPPAVPLSFSEVEVGKDELYLMGDNRLSSHDSTEVGTLLVKDVLGVIPSWALENKGIITRWEAFRDNFRS